MTRYQTGTVVRVQRRDLQGADYNPRQLSKPARQRLKANIGKVGLLGPAIVWNKTTGNVVSGHQRLSVLDALEDGEDYALDVTMVEMSPAQEREQNVFMNSPDAQGEFDIGLLAELLTDADLEVDWKAMGLDRITVEAVLADAGDVDIDSFFADDDRNESDAAKKIKTDAERIASVKRSDTYRDEKMAERGEAESYVTLVFESDAACSAFLERVGQPNDRKHVDGHAVAEALGVDLET